MRLTVGTLLSGCLLLVSTPIFASDTSGGIKFNYTRIFVENLPIGSSISMKKIAKLPLRVTNKFNRPMRLTLRVELPVPPGVKGFAALPDLHWVKTEYQSVTLPAFGEAESDILINLPNDWNLLGKKFQASISASLEDPYGVGLQVGYAATGVFLFSIAPVPNTQALQDVQEHPADATYSIQPPRVDVWNAAFQQTIPIAGPTGEPLRLINQSDKAQTFFLTSVNPAETSFKLDEGAHFIGNVNQVILGEDEIKLGPGQSQSLGIEIHTPAETDFRAGIPAGLIQVASGFRRSIRQYIVIYLHPNPAKTPAQEKLRP
jgi:hypothetical protein